MVTVCSKKHLELSVHLWVVCIASTGSSSNTTFLYSRQQILQINSKITTKANHLCDLWLFPDDEHSTCHWFRKFMKTNAKTNAISGRSDEEGFSAEAISSPQKTPHLPSSSELGPSPHLSGQETVLLSMLIHRPLIRKLFPSFKYGAI